IALIAREEGMRAVSVDEALCLAPRTCSLREEYRRKFRTMARGLQTLWYKRGLMNPLRYGAFSWMLLSHKLCRWLVPLTLPFAAVEIAYRVIFSPTLASALDFGVLVALGAGVIGWCWPTGSPPRLLALCAYAVASEVAGMLAWLAVLSGRRLPAWKPTHRSAFGAIRQG